MKKNVKNLLLLVTICCLAAEQNVFAQLSNQPIKNISGISSPITKSLLVRSTGNEVFSSGFSNTAVGRNDMNAYLLCYLSTLIYPQYLGMVAGNTTKEYEERLHRNPDDFKGEFIKYTKGLFSNPVFEFFNESDRLGYDPEAMVISTASSIFIVFRGTDRVGSNQPGLLYDWAEWISTDFDGRQITSPDLTGKVVSGMWSSLEHNGFKNDILNYIETKGARSKKVWITGHSLGAGQAQLYAMFLAKKGIVAQGVYAYAAPHPGTQEFVTEMDRLFPNQRLQRFDFISDPITTLAPYILGYQPAGTRVYYNDINTIKFNEPDRSAVEVSSIIPGILGAIGNSITDFINASSGNRLKLDNLLGNSTMCYHHPLWYLKAAYQQLNATERAKVPKPLNLPDAQSEACDRLTVERGKNSNPLTIVNNIVKGEIDAAVTAVNETMETIRFVATSIADNVTGFAIAPGDYYIKSYASNSRLAINEQDGFSNGSDLVLTTGRSKVKIERFGTIGYIIQFGTKSVTTSFFGITNTETKSYVLDSETESLYQDGSSEIQLWEKNNLPGFSSNQRWLFIKLKNDKYLIKNLANGKLLDANNGCINDNSCRIKSYKPVTDDQTQIWVLEPAN
jgi:hypothetical protein